MPPLRLKDSLRLLGDSLLDLIYPPICLGCEEEMDRGLVCHECLQEIRSQGPLLCTIEQEEGQSPLVKILSLGYYTRPLNRLIHELKYNGKRSLAPILGQELSRALSSDPLMRSADHLVPIPLHPARQRERGYNQAELLARAISRFSNIPLLDCLERCRNTRSQIALNDAQRRANVKDAFKLKKGFDPSGGWLILVDDVLTTGATISEAARVLRSAGARLIYGLVVARDEAPSHRSKSI